MYRLALFTQNFFQIFQASNSTARAPIALIGDRTDMLCCHIIVVIGILHIFHCVFPARLCTCLEIRTVCVILVSVFIFQNELMRQPGIVSTPIDAVTAFQPVFALPLVRKVTGAAPLGIIRSTIQIISVKLSVSGFWDSRLQGTHIGFPVSFALPHIFHFRVKRPVCDRHGCGLGMHGLPVDPRDGLRDGLYAVGRILLHGLGHSLRDGDRAVDAVALAGKQLAVCSLPRRRHAIAHDLRFRTAGVLNDFPDLLYRRFRSHAALVRYRRSRVRLLRRRHDGGYGRRRVAVRLPFACRLFCPFHIGAAGFFCGRRFRRQFPGRDGLGVGDHLTSFIFDFLIDGRDLHILTVCRFSRGRFRMLSVFIEGHISTAPERCQCILRICRAGNCGISLPSGRHRRFHAGVVRRNPGRGFCLCCFLGLHGLGPCRVLFAFFDTCPGDRLGGLFIGGLFFFRLRCRFCFRRQFAAGLRPGRIPGAVRAGDRRFRCRLAALDGRSVFLCAVAALPLLLRRRGRRGLAGGGGILLGIGGDGLGHGWVFHCTCRWVGGEGGGAEQPDAQAGDQ